MATDKLFHATLHTARKLHMCMACPEPIRPGDKYRKITTPPGIIHEDERGTTHDVGWMNLKYHTTCFDEHMSDWGRAEDYNNQELEL